MTDNIDDDDLFDTLTAGDCDFQVGDNVVYPHHGAGVVRSRAPRKVLEDVLDGFLRGGVHVRVGFGAVVEPGHGNARGPAEAVREVPRLHRGHVLQDAQQVGARGGHGHAQLAFGEPLELPAQVPAGSLQVVPEDGLQPTVGLGAAGGGRGPVRGGLWAHAGHRATGRRQ